MAGSKDYAVLDLQNDSEGLGVDLQFQDFGDTRTQSAGVRGQHEQTITFSDFPDTPEEELEQEKLLGEDDEDTPIGLKKGTGFWTFDFYQQFFNVESKQVGDRILWSMVPKPGVSYLQSYIRPNPDLYGPFWICMTLTFTTAITGNLANYLGTQPEDTYIWRYDFHKVTLAATAIFSYAWLIPLAMWGVIVWRGSRAKISLLELLCIYGYSLSIFVPVSILWIVPQPWFKWCLAIVAPVLSGSVLVRTVWPSLSHDAKQIAIGIAVFILVLHATLALGFMLYFFAAPDRAASNVIPVEPANIEDAQKNQTTAPTKRQTLEGEDAKSNAAKEVAAALQKDPGEIVKEKKAAGNENPVDQQADNSGNKEVAKALQEDSSAGAKAKKSVPVKPESDSGITSKISEVNDSEAKPQESKSDVKEKPATADAQKGKDAAANPKPAVDSSDNKTSQQSKT